MPKDELPIKAVKRSTGETDTAKTARIQVNNNLSRGMEETYDKLPSSDARYALTHRSKNPAHKSIDNALNSGIKASQAKRRGKPRK